MPGATGCRFDRLLLFCVIFLLAVTAFVFCVSVFMGNWLGSGQAMATPIVNASAKHTATVSVAVIMLASGQHGESITGRRPLIKCRLRTCGLDLRTGKCLGLVLGFMLRVRVRVRGYG